ncbi:MAG: protein-glutamate O-methyltransferase CheR [Solirubrobacteraceae bacterium]|nr:protein-glutamate O-methyltransferase CheR [Solirubrobacteraceae bacterium]
MTNTSAARPIARDDDDYLVFITGLRALWPVDLTQYRRGQMERRIRSFAGRRNITHLPDYLPMLKADKDELYRFLDHVTINVSQLWRHPEQWEVLRKELIPELAQEDRIRAWSAGCSYGAEAYTLSAVIRDTAPKARVSITGTDVDRRIIERAQHGRFSDADAREAPQDEMRKWFVQDGDMWSAKPELRFGMKFEEGDLLHTSVPVASYDLIMCRNVVIYFNEDVRDSLHGRLAAALRPGGYLVIGATERVASPGPIGLTPTHPFIYRKA